VKREKGEGKRGVRKRERESALFYVGVTPIDMM
jgi:hypothetical protein